MQCEVGVAAIVLRNPNDPEILLGKRKNKEEGGGNGLYAMPGGGIKYEDNSLVDAVARELKEETGIVCTDFEEFGAYRTKLPNRHWATIFYLTWTEEEPQNLEPHMCEGWEWFNLKDLPQNLWDDFYGANKTVFQELRREFGWEE